MIGLAANLAGAVIGTVIGCLFKKRGISKRYENALYVAVGLAALGIGIENVTENLPKSHYPVLFIISLVVGALIGTWLNLDKHFTNLISKFGGSKLASAIVSETLLLCIGALSMVGPVKAAIKNDNTMLLTAAALVFVCSIIFGAGFGWGMLTVPPILLAWQGGIYLIAKYLSADFFTGPVVVEISLVGGFLVIATAFSLLKIKDIKTLDLLPALFIPVIFFIIKNLTGWF